MIEVLCVDDEIALLELTKHFLEATGEFRVKTVQSAAAALSRMDEHGFDAVVSDYQMPEMDGIELLKTLRARGDGIPFILFTGRGREDVAIDALNKGADFYLQKGGNPRSQFAELSNLIRQSVSSRRTDAALRESEERYRQLAESAADAIFTIDASGRILYINSAGSRLFGRAPEAVIGENVELLTPHGAAFVGLSKVTDVLRSGRSMRLVERMPAEKNCQSWFDLLLVPLRDRSGKAASVLGIARDITELKKNEARITRLNRMYAFLMRTNEAIVRVRDMESLFMETCRIVVESGGFKMAWVGLLDRATGAIRMISCHGIEEGVRESLRMSFRDEPAGQGPLERAVRSGEIVVVNDIANDPGTAPWKAVAAELGFRSIAAMPFFSGKNVVASMVIYSDEIDFFDKEEVELLREVSYDISFALGSMDRDKTMQRSEDKSACQSFIIEGMEDAFFVSDEKSLVTGWNKAAEELFGWTADEALGRDSSALLKTEWVDMAEDEVKRLLGETGRVRVRASHRSKSGDVIITESVVNAVLGPQGRTKGYVTASRPVAVRKVAGGAVSD